MAWIASTTNDDETFSQLHTAFGARHPSDGETCAQQFGKVSPWAGSTLPPIMAKPFHQRFRRPCRRKGFAGTRVAQSPPGTSKPFRKTPLRNLTDGETFLERFRRRANRLTAKPFGPPGTAKPFPGYLEKVSPSYHYLKKGFQKVSTCMGAARNGAAAFATNILLPSHVETFQRFRRVWDRPTAGKSFRGTLRKVSTCLGFSGAAEKGFAVHGISPPGEGKHTPHTR